MEGYINENRWVDLSGLPKKKWKNGELTFNWKQSVGCELPFKFDNVENIIKIQNYCNGKNDVFVYITIDKYVPEPYKITISQLKNCQLKQFVSNRIADTCPNIMVYLLNPNEAYKYSYGSNKYILTKCPVCGNIEEKQIIKLYKNGFNCSVCSDGISIPNKIMYNILSQLQVDFIREVGKKQFSWMDNYRYDFYFISKCGKDILIEMDGGFHEFPIQKRRDECKNNLAEQNGFVLIRIDCNYNKNEFEYIKSNIIQSKLDSFLPIKNIDWNKCKMSIKNTILQQICYLWENEICGIREIAHKLKISTTTTQRYLSRGKDIGLCPSYNAIEAQHRRKGVKIIAIIKDGVIKEIFRSSLELVNVSEKMFGRQFHRANILQACRTGKPYLGYYIKEITKEEYLQYKMIEHNNKVV